MKLILGTGKSIICSQLVSTTRDNEKLTAVYFLCNHRDSGDHEFLRMMRYIAYQILRGNVETVPIVHQLYVLKGLSATTPVMKALLRQLASGIQHIRCIIDGLDECDRGVQTEVIKLILELRKASDSFKAIVSSRDLPQIDRHLRPKITISLFQKTEQALRLYIRNGVQCLQDSCRCLAKSTVNRLEDHLVRKAGGEVPSNSS